MLWKESDIGIMVPLSLIGTIFILQHTRHNQLLNYTQHEQ